MLGFFVERDIKLNLGQTSAAGNIIYDINFDKYFC